MLRWLFYKSKWLHRYLGLLLILYGIIMGVSGIFVNHPTWIDGFSIPTTLVPNQYRPQNWDRSALAGVVYDPANPNRLLTFGEAGVYESTNAGLTFTKLSQGFPASAYLQKTNDLIFINNPSTNTSRILAATVAGLFIFDDSQKSWTAIPLKDHTGPTGVEVRSILQIENQLIILTRNTFFTGRAEASDLNFQPVIVERAPNESSHAGRESMVFFFFDAHSGKILGLPGQLLFDIIGVIIILLCFSAFYLWIYPKKIHRARAKNNKIKLGRTGKWLFRNLFYYHLKVGIYVSPVLVIMGFTGFFMRPPLLAIPAQLTVPLWMMPFHPHSDEWTGRILRAVYDESQNRLLVECTDGFWSASVDLKNAFIPTKIDLPTHVMGTNLLTNDEKYGLVAGSFSGLFAQNSDDAIIDLTTGLAAHDVSRFRSADEMATAFFRTPDGAEYLATFHDGLKQINAPADTTPRFQMPLQINTEYRMPLWNYMFEIHNGRFFRDWIAGLYFWVPILGSAFFFLLTITGIFDWAYIWLMKQRSQSTRRPPDNWR